MNRHHSEPQVADDQAVVVGIDGSDSSQNALRFAISAAQDLGHSIRLVGAYTVPSVAAATIDVSYVPIDDTSVRAAVTDTLKAAAAQVREAGVSVEAVIEIGDAAGVLVDETAQASLVVVGSRGRGGFAGRLLGTVSTALPAHSKCPTVVVPLTWSPDATDRTPDCSSSHPIRSSRSDAVLSEESSDLYPGMDFAGSVVVGIDALGKESPALWAAARIANQRKVPLQIVGVITTTVVGPEWLPSDSDVKRFVDEGEDTIVLAANALRDKYPSLPTEWTLFDGQPSEVLVRAADTADLLVIGSRGRGGFAGLLLGSTSQSVLPYAKCPTMVVRVGGGPQR